MKQFLILLVTGILVFMTGTAAAVSPVDLLCIMDGITPDSMEFENLFFDDSLPEDCPESWEIRNGVLYDTEAKILLTISYSADFGGTLTVEPGTRCIYADALEMNETIREIILPDGLEVIGPRALTGPVADIDNATGIQTVHVPASVRLIQEPLGTGASSLNCCKPFFIVDENNPRYASTPEGLLIDKTEGAVLWCASFPETRTVTVPEGIRRIAPFAFSGCHEIISVSLPDSLIEIGDGAFRMMSGLTEITIPENVLRIGADNFSWVGRDENEQWFLDENDHIIIGPADAQDHMRKLTDEEALREFGISRRPGITFSGTEFLLQASAPDGIYVNNNFNPCSLPVECPAGALCLTFLEDGARYSVLPSWQLTVVEPDGSTRVVGNE